MPNRQLRVFLCHSSKDKSAVRELYKKLHAETWIDPWLDEEKLLPGQDWHMEIEKAVEATDVVMVLLSNHSVSQEGFVQRELKLALDMADEKPENTIFIVPLRLEDCLVPRRLRDWHYVDYFPSYHKEWVLARLIDSLKTRAESLGLKFEKPTQPKVSKPIEEKMPVFHLKPAPAIKPIYKDKLIFSNGMEFLHVPAGKFIMGSNYGVDVDDIKPLHTVDIPYDYWMARFLVTNEHYNVYVKTKGIEHPVPDWQKKKDHPIVNVSWDTVMEYCKWLTALLKGELPLEMVARLPTEAEWEKAARGTDGYEFPWGYEFDKNKCNSREGGKSSTTPVGAYSPQGDTLYGCADMAGNVREWTHSEHKAYPYNAKDGREDEQRNFVRVSRGGGFNNFEWDVSCAIRYWGDPDRSFDYLSFRVVIAPPLHPS